MAEAKAVKKKPKTNAERQREYRQRNMYRINTIIDADTSIDLKLLTKHYAVTKREVLQMLVKNEAEKMKKKLSEKELDALYDEV